MAVTAGVGSILLLGLVLAFLVVGIFPLLLPTTFQTGPVPESPVMPAPLPAGARVILEGNFAWMLDDGTLLMFRTDTGKVWERRPLVPGRQPTAWATDSSGRHVVLGFADGGICLVRLEPATGQGSPRDAVRVGAAETLRPPGGPAVSLLDFTLAEGRPTLCWLTADGRLHRSLRPRPSHTTAEESSSPLPGATGPTPPVRLFLFGDGASAALVWRNGRLLRMALAESAPPRVVETLQMVDWPTEEVSALDWLPGRNTLLVGDSAGRVRAWFRVPARFGDGTTLVAAHELAGNGAAVTCLGPAAERHLVVAGTADGHVRLWQVSGERLLAEFQVSPHSAIQNVGLSPDGAHVLALTTDRLRVWRTDTRHAEATPAALWQPVWYEGLSRPVHAWQPHASGEPRLGLLPLVLGTGKATLFALLVAGPLGLLAAVYTSEFMSARARNLVKPAVELTAGIPGVVFGFLAVFVVGPFLGRHLSFVLAAFVTVPLTLVVAGWLWRFVPRRVRPGAPRYRFPAIVLTVMLGLLLARLLDSLWRQFGLELRGLLPVAASEQNVLVIGLVLGFALVPVIFTLADDALAAVPASLRAASLGCGASPWQTVRRVVLPVAGSGLLAALLVGLGRAMGETMIVLMVTGDVPLLDLDPFRGGRPVTAVLAGEFAAAPPGGTHYRVLLLAALLLFLVTAGVHVGAERLRAHFRRRAAQL